MRVVEATREHAKDAQLWLSLRGKKPWPLAMFDAPGFVVEGVAAVWLYATPPFALIEALVANPDVAPSYRNDALDAVVTAALAEAERQGVRVVYSTTTIDAVRERAERLGFETIHQNAALIIAQVGGRS